MLEQVETLTIHSGSTNTPNYSIFIMLAAIAIIVLFTFVIRQEMDKKRIQMLQNYKSELESKKNGKRRVAGDKYPNFTD